MHKTLIDPSTLAQHLGDPNWVIVDCRFDLANPVVTPPPELGRHRE